MPRLSQRASLVVAVAIGLGTWPLSGQAPVDQSTPPAAQPQEAAPRQEPIAPQALQATQHPAVPQSLDDFWLVPSEKERAAAKDAGLGAAAKAYAAGDYSAALASLHPIPAPRCPSTCSSTRECRICGCRVRPKPRRRSTTDRAQSGRLSVGRRIAGEGGGGREPRRSCRRRRDLRALSALKAPAPEDVLARLGRASLAAGNRASARPKRILRVYYEFPLTDAGRAPRDRARLAAGPDRPQGLQARSRPRADPVRRQALRRGAQRAAGHPEAGRAATIAKWSTCASPRATTS